MFKVGETVRIARKVEFEAGWNNCWVDAMDQAIGTEVVITEVGPEGVFYQEGPFRESYGFPPSSLEPLMSYVDTAPRHPGPPVDVLFSGGTRGGGMASTKIIKGRDLAGHYVYDIESNLLSSYH